MVKASDQVMMPSMRRCCFLALVKSTNHLSKNACDSGSVCSVLTESNCPKSMHLPTTIWRTVFPGIDEKPGPTTNDCWSNGPNGRFAVKVLSLSGTKTEGGPAAINVLKIGERRVTKVGTNDGAVKLGLPCVVEGEDIAYCSGKAPPA